MKKTLVLTMMAFIIAIVGVRPINAQEFAFQATFKTAPGVTNLGSVGAISGNGVLGATTRSGITGFRGTDVASSTPTNALGPEIFAVGTVPVPGSTTARSPRLVILSAIGDGTFSLPQS